MGRQDDGTPLLRRRFRVPALRKKSVSLGLGAVIPSRCVVRLEDGARKKLLKRLIELHAPLIIEECTQERWLEIQAQKGLDASGNAAPSSLVERWRHGEEHSSGPLLVRSSQAHKGFHFPENGRQRFVKAYGESR